MNRTQGLKAVLLGSVGVLALSIGPAMAGELEDLKAQLNKQNAELNKQNNVIQQLQDRLDQVEKQQATPDDATAADDEANDTQVQVTQGARVAPSTEAGPADAVVGGDFPGSFKLPGSDTSVGIHGFVQADFIYDFNQQLGDTFQMSKIAPHPGTAQHEGDQFHFSARQSRLSFETRTPTDYGLLRTVIVTDFLGGAAGPGLLGSGGTGSTSAGFGNAFVTNSYVLRVRQAFADFGPLRAGQDYSNFTDADALPQLFDGFGPAGQTKVRQTQLRYTQEMANWRIAFAFENPQSDWSSNIPGAAATPGFVAGSYGSAGTATPAGAVNPPLAYETVPDFTLSVRYADNWGYLKLAGLVRRIGANTGDPASGFGTPGEVTQRVDTATVGSGGVLSGVFNLGWLLPFLGKDQVGFNAYGGSGLGRYTNYGGNFNDGAALKNFGAVNDRLVTNSSEGGFVWFQHNWTDMLRSNFVFGAQHNHWSVTTPLTTGQVAAIESVHANLMWSPVKPVSMGLEAMYANKQFRDTRGVSVLVMPGLAGNSAAHDLRLQASMQVLF